MLQRGVQVLLEGAFEGNVGNPVGGDHDLLRLLVRELEGPDDDLCLAVAHDTSPVRLGEDQLEFIFRERRIVGDAVPHAVDNPGRHSLENPQRTAEQRDGQRGGDAREEAGIARRF